MAARITYTPPFKKNGGKITTRQAGNIIITSQSIDSPNARAFEFEDQNGIVNSNGGASPSKYQFAISSAGNVKWGVQEDNNVLGMGFFSRGMWVTSEGYNISLGGGRFGVGVVDTSPLTPNAGFVGIGEYLSENGIFLWYNTIFPGSVVMTIGTTDPAGTGSNVLPFQILIAGQRRLMIARSDYAEPTLELQNNSTNESDIRGTNSNWSMSVYGGHKVTIPSTTGRCAGMFMEVTVDTGNASAGTPLTIGSDGNFDDATATDAGIVSGISLQPGTGAGIEMALPGSIITNTNWTWTPGGAIYVDANGGLSQTAPTTTGQFVKRVGVALSANSMHFFPTSIIELS